MYIRKENSWELWPGCHPESCPCPDEEEENGQCDCKYHVVDEKHTKNYNFHDFLDAEKKFCELTGGLRFILGKTKWQDGKVIPV